MRAAAINPHRRIPAYQREHAGRPRVRTLVVAMCAIWAAALILGFRAEYGTWPPTVSDGAPLPLAYGVIALPSGLAQTMAGVLGSLACVVLGLLFWPLVPGLRVAACYHGRWIHLLPVALLAAAAGWGWSIAAVAMTSIRGPDPWANLTRSGLPWYLWVAQAVFAPLAYQRSKEFRPSPSSSSRFLLSWSGCDSQDRT